MKKAGYQIEMSINDDIHTNHNDTIIRERKDKERQTEKQTRLNIAKRKCTSCRALPSTIWRVCVLLTHLFFFFFFYPVHDEDADDRHGTLNEAATEAERHWVN